MSRQAIINRHTEGQNNCRVDPNWQDESSPKK